MPDGPGSATDPDRPRACADCGWQGPVAAVYGATAGDTPGVDLACPRCGAPCAPEMPSVAELLAARRTPLPED